MSFTSTELARAIHTERQVEFVRSRQAHHAAAARRLQRRAERLSEKAERVSRRADRAARQARLAVARAL
jgi:hypothetical protein